MGESTWLALSLFFLETEMKLFRTLLLIIVVVLVFGIATGGIRVLVNTPKGERDVRDIAPQAWEFLKEWSFKAKDAAEKAKDKLLE